MSDFVRTATGVAKAASTGYTIYKGYKKFRASGEDMPKSTRKYARKSPSRKRKTFTRRRGRVAGMAKKVAKLWEHAEVERPPKHIMFSDQSITGFNPPGFNVQTYKTNPVLNFMAPCARGTNVQGRLADYIYISKVSLSCLTVFGTGISGDVIVKWMLFMWKQPRGATLTASAFNLDYFGTATPASNSIPNINNKDVRAKYRILKTGQFQLKETVAGVIEYHKHHINWYTKKPIRCGYTLGTAGTIADVDTNALYLMYYTDSTVSALGITTTIEGNVYFRDQV